MLGFGVLTVANVGCWGALSCAAAAQQLGAGANEQAAATHQLKQLLLSNPGWHTRHGCQ